MVDGRDQFIVAIGKHSFCEVVFSEARFMEIENACMHMRMHINSLTLLLYCVVYVLLSPLEPINSRPIHYYARKNRTFLLFALLHLVTCQKYLVGKPNIGGAKGSKK